METIYDILSAEHRQVADLLQQALRDGSKESFFKVKAKTDPHLMGEEKLFYPVLEQKKELRDLINHAFQEHNQIKSISSELEGLNASEQNWISIIKELNDAVNHHVQEEENKVFPAARNILSQSKAEDIAQQYRQFEQTFKQQQQASMR